MANGAIVLSLHAHTRTRIQHISFNMSGNVHFTRTQISLAIHEPMYKDCIVLERLFTENSYYVRCILVYFACQRVDLVLLN